MVVAVIGTGVAKNRGPMVVRQSDQPLRNLFVLGIGLGLISVARLVDPKHRAGQSNRYAALLDRSFGHLAPPSLCLTGELTR